jgi:hypothetical protein
MMFLGYFASEYTASLSRKSPESTGPCFSLIELAPRTLWNCEKFAGRPRPEDFKAVHQRIMQMWKDRVSGEANATHQLTQRHAITRPHDHAAGLHVHKQGVLAILMVEQYEITDVFRIFASRKSWMPDLRGLGIFKPVFRNVICDCQNNARSIRAGDRRNTAAPLAVQAIRIQKTD